MQSLMENTYSSNIMTNLGFLLVYKYLESTFQGLLVKRQNSVSALRNASCSMTRLKWDKRVDVYKSITFTLKKESDLFFASIKNQKW